MGKQLFPKLVYLGALSLLVFVFTLILLIAAATLFIPNNIGFAFGVSTRSFTIAAVSFFTAVAVAVFLFVRALQRRELN
jgi:asparagine N-glycosylation enzyme membrane subunit Stt3